MSQIECNNCGAQNDFYKLNCDQCSALIRGRVVNIDLWNIIWLVIDSPQKAFQKIIHAEHKNFIILLSILAGMKVFLDVQFSSNLIFGKSPDISEFMLYLLVSIVLFVIIIVLISLGIKTLNLHMNIRTRLKDNIAIYIYSFLPLIFGLVLLLPVEYALFGNHWLTFDPSPFIVKTTPAWVLASLEIALHLWSIILTMVATFAYTGKKLYSIVTGFIIQLIVIGVYVGIASLI
jgi:hypothetical protein